MAAPLNELLAKLPSSRLQPGRASCSHCDDQPQGFRGKHELRRHMDREHTPVRIMWVTVEPSTVAPDGPLPKIPLAKCKMCQSGKQYFPYYNAAAHLRRAHFNPRKKRKDWQVEEKRGGKGGMSVPSMDVLRHWMKAIEVRRDVAGVD